MNFDANSDLNFDVVVIGGGIIGLSSAWQLAESGLKIAVVERDHFTSGTSHICGGMLAPNAEAKFTEPKLLKASIASFERWASFRDDLETVSGRSIGYRNEGTLMIALERDDLARLDHAKHQHDALGLKTQILSADAIREREPNLSPRTLRGMFLEDDHQVDAHLVMLALIDACKSKRVYLYEKAGEPIVSEKKVHFGEVEISYSNLLYATGAWKVKRKDAPNIKPIKGQMIVLDTPEPICKHVIRAPDAYLIPKEKHMLIGATMEEMGFNEGKRAGSVMDLLVGAWEAMPAIYDLDIQDLWTGFRPIGLVSEPVVAASSEKNVFYATGHGRNGVLLTPWTAQRVVNLINR